MLVAIQEQQSKSNMNNDGCGSGGTNPVPESSLDNEIKTIIQVGN
jgi:hypothetical protein